MPKDHELYEWVKEQRRGRKGLSQDQVAALNVLGFSWNLQLDEYNALWEKRYQELVKFKNEHGHTLVPQSNKELGRFVSSQRKGWRDSQLIAKGLLDPKTRKVRTISAERKKKLDAIDFTWTAHTPHKGWDERFEELVAYKETYGNCQVPQHWPKNKTLGKWVAKQRYQYSLFQQGKRDIPFTQERLDRLNSIGFDWGNTRPNVWKSSPKEVSDEI